MDSQQLRYVLLNFVNCASVVCSIDQLKSLSDEPKAIICNNQPSYQSGMHWVCFYRADKNSCVEFFDSFAMSLSFYGPEFIQFVQNSGKTLRVSNFQYQSNVSDLCGAYCLNFLIHRSKGLSFDQIVTEFSTSDLDVNDRIISNFVLKNLHFPKFSECGVTCSGNCLQNLGSVCVQTNKRCVRLQRKLQTPY
jgi:hypothetical protein